MTGDVTNVVLEDLNELQVSKPVSYHAVKSAELLNGLHSKILTKKISSLIQQTGRLKREIDAMMALIDMENVSNTNNLFYILAFVRKIREYILLTRLSLLSLLCV